MDALALFMTGSNGNDRIIGFAKKHIPELAAKKDAEMFCNHFRHGLVHEARVKRGSEFSTEINRIVDIRHNYLVVNPLLLAIRVKKVLEDYIVALYRDPNAKKALAKKLKRTFRFELEH